MSSTKPYLDFILEQLLNIPNLTYRPMMGEYLLYSNDILFGGVYDDRLLIKIAPGNDQLGLPEAIPYPGAKPMYLIEDVDDKKKLTKIIKKTVNGLFTR